MKSGIDREKDQRDGRGVMMIGSFRAVINRVLDGLSGEVDPSLTMEILSGTGSWEISLRQPVR